MLHTLTKLLPAYVAAAGRRRGAGGVASGPPFCAVHVVHTAACRERRVSGNHPGGAPLHDERGYDGERDMDGDRERDPDDSDDSDSDGGGSGSGSGEEGQESEQSEGGEGTKKRRQGAERQGRQRQQQRQQRGEQRRQLGRTRAMREHREKVASGSYSEALSHTVSAVMADLPPHTTLALCYAACLTLRHPITPQDIVRWASDGSLPYLDLPTLSQPVLGRPHPTLALRPGATVRLPDVMLQPKGVPGVGRLQRSAVDLAHRLGWRLPGLAVELLLLRWVQELGLDPVSPWSSS
ncbi:MAG: hypothetical protein WDW38_010765 [Sanguina aurantia]